MWTVTGSVKFLTKLKTGSSRLKTVRTAENVERVANDEQHAELHTRVNCSCRFRPTATSFALRCRSTPISTLMYQFYEAQLPVFFSVNVEIIVRNITINDVQLQNSNLEFGIPPISYT